MTAETAVVAADRGRRVAVTAGFFAYAALPGVWAVRIPSVQDARHLSVGVLGLCLLTPAVGAVAVMPLAGTFVSRSGARAACAGAALVMTAALPLLALAPGVAGFVVALAFFGAAGAVIDVALNVEAVAVEAGYGRSLLAGMHGSWSLGALAGTGVGAASAAAELAPAAVFGVTAPVCLGALLLCARRLSAHRSGIGEPALARPDRRTLQLGLLVFCSLFVESAAADWSAVYLHRSTGASLAAAGAGFAAFSAAMVAGRLSGDRVVDGLGPVRATRWPAFTGALVLALALATRSYALSVAGLFVAGAGTAILFPMAMVAAGRDRRDPAHAIAATATVGYLGWVLAPGVIGGLASLASLPLALGSASVLLVLAAVLAGRLGQGHGEAECEVRTS